MPTHRYDSAASRPQSLIYRVVTVAIMVGALGIVSSLTGIATTTSSAEVLADADRATTSNGHIAVRADFTQTGVDESSLIVVIAGEYPTQAEAIAAEEAFAFGEFDGFYVDSGANYELLGMYSQSSPQKVRIGCGSSQASEIELDCTELGIIPTITAHPSASQFCDQAVAVGLDCENTVHDLTSNTVTLANPPVTLDHTGDLTALTSASSCGDDFTAPCLSSLSTKITTAGQLDTQRYYRLTAFRTKQGAEEFVDLLRTAALLTSDNLAIARVKKLSGPYIGLGQEASPDGSGPLQWELPEQIQLQGVAN